MLRLIISMLAQPLFYTPDEYLLILNPFCTFFTCKRTKNIKNLFVSLLNNVLSYDCQGYGIPYLSAIDQGGDIEVMTTLSLHLLLVLIEYKPPSLENMKHLINGGHVSLTQLRDFYSTRSTEETES